MLAEGVLPASHADELVRLSPETQQELVWRGRRPVCRATDSGRDGDDDGKPHKILISFRAAQADLIADDYTRKSVVGAVEVGRRSDLVKKAGACNECPKNSARMSRAAIRRARCVGIAGLLRGEARGLRARSSWSQPTAEAREQAGFSFGPQGGHVGGHQQEGVGSRAEAVKISPKIVLRYTDIEQDRSAKDVYFGGSYNPSYAIAKAWRVRALARPAVVVEGPEIGTRAHRVRREELQEAFQE
jgi:hypothetical protein